MCPGSCADFKYDAERYIFRTLSIGGSIALRQTRSKHVPHHTASISTISVEVYVQAREIFTLFATLMNAAQLRRLFLLKDIRAAPECRTAQLRSRPIEDTIKTGENLIPAEPRR